MIVVILVISSGHSPVGGKDNGGGAKTSVTGKTIAPLQATDYDPEGDGQESPGSSRSALMPGRFDAGAPVNAAKLDAADALGKLAADCGTTLPELAVAFVIRHPGVTSAIIGPRTMEQLTGQLGATDFVVPDEVLDRIDEIVPPGSNLVGADGGGFPQP